MHVANHLAVVMLLGVVVDTRIYLFRYDPYLAVRIHESMRKAALPDITVPATQVVVLQLVHIFLADDEHLRKVIRAFPHTKQFGFHKRRSGKAPASPCCRLVLNRGSGNRYHFRKLVPLTERCRSRESQHAR